ncbi:MAG: ABC transporter substrate-binding protein [Gordonia amarae]
MSRAKRPLSRRYSRPITRVVIGCVATALTLTSCADSGEQLDESKALPTTVAPDAEISVATAKTKVALTANGEIGKIPFRVKNWAAITGGPDVIQGFKGGSVDLATNAGMPSIQAHTQGVKTKIVAVQVRSLPTQKLATAPGTDISTLQDLRGKRIAFSAGQAQGLVVLQSLKDAGLSVDDVTLVELNSPQFLTALQGKQVDVAPLGEPVLTKYLKEFGPEGARSIHTDALDALSVLWAPVSALADDKKLSAITEFAKLWAKGEVWQWENPDKWIDAYYVKDQGVTADDGRRIIDSLGQPYFPTDWTDAITWEQDTVDLVTDAGLFGGKSFDASELFDRRFEKVIAGAIPDKYKTAPAVR